jgi:hypothetical protein
MGEVGRVGFGFITNKDRIERLGDLPMGRYRGSGAGNWRYSIGSGRTNGLSNSNPGYKLLYHISLIPRRYVNPREPRRTVAYDVMRARRFDTGK